MTNFLESVGSDAALKQICRDEWVQWFTDIPHNPMKHVKVWPFQLPRILPPPSASVVSEPTDRREFAEYFSPVCNSDYTSQHRAVDIRRAHERVAEMRDMVQLKALTKKEMVSLKGNPYSHSERLSGLIPAHYHMEFTLAQVQEEVGVTTDQRAEVDVHWYLCRDANPTNNWFPVLNNLNQKFISKTLRTSIVLRNVTMISNNKKLSGLVCKVVCFFISMLFN
jgi:hypothetical protein